MEERIKERINKLNKSAVTKIKNERAAEKYKKALMDQSKGKYEKEHDRQVMSKTRKEQDEKYIR